MWTTDLNTMNAFQERLRVLDSTSYEPLPFHYNQIFSSWFKRCNTHGVLRHVIWPRLKGDSVFPNSYTPRDTINLTNGENGAHVQMVHSWRFTRSLTLKKVTFRSWANGCETKIDVDWTEVSGALRRSDKRFVWSIPRPSPVLRMRCCAS